jgi:hypothetical protein
MSKITQEHPAQYGNVDALAFIIGKSQEDEGYNKILTFQVRKRKRNKKERKKKGTTSAAASQLTPSFFLSVFLFIYFFGSSSRLAMSCQTRWWC